MDIERLSRFGNAVKERAIGAWKLVEVQSKPLLHWLQLSPKIIFWAGGLGVALAFLIFSGATAAGAALLAWAALRQAATASDRHQEQTNADRQRRITESFSKAVEQLSNEKLEVRLGGIYLLERISKESPDDYWTVMETLTAFVRERSQRNYAEFKKSDERISQVAHALWEEKGKPEGKDDEIWAKAIQLGETPATDIDAVLTVIKRRSKESREREDVNGWRLNLSQAVLKIANLKDVHLERTDLRDAYLERGNLWGTHLERADLIGAHLEEAFLGDAHLEGGDLRNVHLEEVYLIGAHLEGANLWGAWGISTQQLLQAHGDPVTRLPDGVDRPPHWPPPATPPGPAAP